MSIVGDESILELKYNMVIPVQSKNKEMEPSTSTVERQPAYKATLYCPECGHESRINGDWIIHVLTDSLTYECPTCETAIDSRRNKDELTARSSGSLHFVAEN
jgi:predicted RNA-binding Zn-ribbon protein involved in translation (DUF1610 family)